ncbi:MAG: NAD-dependent epimerase [Hyphomonadaceae bacterium]|nr:NAD-dependent epimerase [Hyphomonadaceae bacterium]
MLGGRETGLMRVLVTGSAGFIGAAVTQRLLDEGHTVTGVDNFNDYYDPSLKRARLERVAKHPNFICIEADLADRAAIETVFADHRPTHVINLAAQAGVRYAAVNPHVYVASNVTGFLHILEGCRAVGVKHLVFASTSSVYGANRTLPFSVHQGVAHPLTLYAATKLSNEMMAHSYANMFGLPCTGLRFFSVYGPWGRPDMALFLFTKAILRGEPIQVFNGGDHRRDFTYVDDVAQSVTRLAPLPPSSDPAWDAAHPDPATSLAPFRLFNVGAERPVPLMRFIELIEENLGRRATIEFLPLQPGDVPEAEADARDLSNVIGYRPDTPVEVGVKRFVAWYRAFYDV